MTWWRRSAGVLGAIAWLSTLLLALGQAGGRAMDAGESKGGPHVAAASQGGPVTGSGAAASLAEEIELRGRVVCLAEVMHDRYGTDLAAHHPHVLALETATGAFYTLLPTKFSEALFVDERLRQRELLLKGRVFPNSHVFEVTRTRSVREGVVQDLFYYCSVCSIETVSPGACACCQGQVELVERPLTHKADSP